MGNQVRTKTYSEALWDLEQRMSRLESMLGVGVVDAESEARAQPKRVPAHISGSHHEPVARAPLQEARPEVTPAPPPVMPPAVMSPPVMPPPMPVRRPMMEIPQPIIPAYAPPPPVEPVAQTALEQTIGLKWAGWIGAVVVVIGAGLGIKFAYEQGWFNILPPAARLALMSLGGFGLIAAGEVVYRRIHRVAAACLFGAGVATLFLVSYAGHAYYRLYEPETAFVLMGLTTLIGAAVAARGNMLPIAILAQIGGNLAPVLLRSDQPHLVPFLTYLLTLQLVALALSWWGGPGRWWTLRVMSLATTSLWLLAVLSDPHTASTSTLVTFSLIYAGLFQAELLLSVARPRVAEPALKSAGPLSISTDPSTPVGLSAVFSVLVTALLTTAILGILHAASDATRGAWVLGLGGACAALGFGLSRKRASDYPLHPLGIAYRVQAAALVVVAVPVALSGVWIVFGWALLGLAFAVLGERLDLGMSRWAGAVVWRLALAYLGWWTLTPVIHDIGHSQTSGPHAVWLHLLGADVRAYAVLTWLLAIVGHLIAWIITRPTSSASADEDSVHRFQRIAWLNHATAGFAWFAASVTGLPPAGSTLAILFYAWLLLGADLLLPRLGLLRQAAVIVVLVTLKWIAVDTLAERLSPGWSAVARRPVFNAVMGVGLLISLTMGALYWLRREALWGALARRESANDEDPHFSPAAPFLALAAAVLALFVFGMSVEIDRIVEASGAAATLWPLGQIKAMGWTVLWMLCLCGFIALSRKLEPAAARRPQWVRGAEVLALLVTMKFLIVDTVFFRLFNGAVRSTPLVNLQTLTALVVVGGMILVACLSTRDAAAERQTSATGGLFAIAGFLAILVVLWAGTLEIDRVFERMIAAGSAAGSGAFADPRRAKQVAFSIFWSVFAVSCVLSGFRFRTAGLRYFGLGLFAVTLLKVVVLDMSQVQTGYRVLSFLGLGLLLMGTSVLYGKLSPMLLRKTGDESDAAAPIDATVDPSAV